MPRVIVDELKAIHAKSHEDAVAVFIARNIASRGLVDIDIRQIQWQRFAFSDDLAGHEPSNTTHAAARSRRAEITSTGDWKSDLRSTPAVERAVIDIPVLPLAVKVFTDAINAQSAKWGRCWRSHQITVFGDDSQGRHVDRQFDVHDPEGRAPHTRRIGFIANGAPALYRYASTTPGGIVA